MAARTACLQRYVLNVDSAANASTCSLFAVSTCWHYCHCISIPQGAVMAVDAKDIPEIPFGRN